MMRVTTWAEAKAAGLRKYFTGKPCKAGHIGELHISGGCIACRQIAYQKWAENKKARKLQLAQSYRSADPQKYLDSAQRYKNENRESVRASARDWKASNQSRYRELTAKWRRNNPGKVAASNRARKLRQTRATPAWADLKAIREIYIEAARLGMHVDHIIPLNGESVCGLHVEGNLQLLTPMQNAVKGNSFDDEQIDDLHLVRQKVVKGGQVKVVITPIEGCN